MTVNVTTTRHFHPWPLLKEIAVVAVGASWFGFLAFVPAPDAPAALVDDRAPEYVCYEDQPCWDCATMGNRRCGPTPPARTPDAVPSGVAVGGVIR